MADKYKVRILGAGNYGQGQVITKEEAGPWFDKWVAEGAISPLTSEEQKALDQAEKQMTEEEKAAGIAPERSHALATGDIDERPPSPEDLKKQQAAAAGGAGAGATEGKK